MLPEKLSHMPIMPTPHRTEDYHGLERAFSALFVGKLHEVNTPRM